MVVRGPRRRDALGFDDLQSDVELNLHDRGGAHRILARLEKADDRPGRSHARTSHWIERVSAAVRHLAEYNFAADRHNRRVFSRLGRQRTATPGLEAGA